MRDGPEAGVDQRFTSNEVVGLTGITPRQLQWWDERGIVRPAREGRVRVYSTEELAEVAVICELRRCGFSLQRVRKVMRFLQREFGKRLAETVTSGSEYHLLTDGKRIYLETDARLIIDSLKNARQPMLTVCLTDAVRRVGAELNSTSFKSARNVLPFASKTVRSEPAREVQRNRTVGRR
jgi:DNA-binding transcriptional MerR regulator